jgi:hypothetical protein
MTPQEEMERAERARQILADPFFTEHVSQIEQALLGAIRRTAFVDEKLREKLTHRWTALHDVLAALRSTMETGRLAAKQLEIEEQQKTWRQRAKEAIF